MRESGWGAKSPKMIWNLPDKTKAVSHGPGRRNSMSKGM